MYGKPLNLLALVVVGTTGDPRNKFRRLKLGRLSGGVAIALFAMIGTASAYTITVQVAPAQYTAVTPPLPFTLMPLGTSPSGSNTYLNSDPISSNGETITFTSSFANPSTFSGLYVGNSGGGALSPFGNGDSTTNYLAAGTSGFVGSAYVNGFVTIDFATPQTELDFLWGTVDYNSQNVLTVGGHTFTGNDIFNQAVAQGVFTPSDFNGTNALYNMAVEITGLPSFTEAVFEDALTTPAFEFVPAVPASSVVTVPEPSSLALLGSAFFGFCALFRLGRRRPDRA